MCHVLIIEDEWLIADYLTYLAEQAGATSVSMACTEDEAVHSAFEQTPSIIFSDVNLPDGTGPHAVRTIMARLGEIPVVFITATPDACRAFEPASIVLQKPVDPASFLRAFRCSVPNRLGGGIHPPSGSA